MLFSMHPVNSLALYMQLLFRRCPVWILNEVFIYLSTQAITASSNYPVHCNPRILFDIMQCYYITYVS
jgi:hypothetical protein